MRTGQPGIGTTEDPLGTMVTWEGGCSYQVLSSVSPFSLFQSSAGSISSWLVWCLPIGYLPLSLLLLWSALHSLSWLGIPLFAWCIHFFWKNICFGRAKEPRAAVLVLPRPWVPDFSLWSFIAYPALKGTIPHLQPPCLLWNQLPVWGRPSYLDSQWLST